MSMCIEIGEWLVKVESECLSDALWMIREQIKMNKQEQTKREANSTSKPRRRISTRIAKLYPSNPVENCELFADSRLKPVEKPHFSLDMILEVEGENEKSDS